MRADALCVVFVMRSQGIGIMQPGSGDEMRLRAAEVEREREGVRGAVRACGLTETEESLAFLCTEDALTVRFKHSLH